ncbi:retropepsin-like aspartic protease [Algoriphagus yeomjeoni]|uniref:retropepsin-like aspartic protease n=1 Tax=Algoriphagus yeomjeoni TaxID=291403 RepID=UPI003CE5B39B
MIKRLFVAIILMTVGAFFYSKYVRNVTEVIPFEVIRQSIFFNVEIEGKSYTFQFDTGAGTSISPELQEKLKLDTIGTQPSLDLYNNFSIVDEVMLPELKLGTMVTENMEVAIMRPIQSFTPCDKNVDGYLGLEFFDGKVLKIDLRNKEIIVANSIGALQENFGIPLEMEYHHGRKRPHINISYPELKGKENVIFDTGSGNDFLKLSKNTFQQMLEHGELSQKSILDTTYIHEGRGLFGGQKDTINYTVNISKLVIGNTTFDNLTTQTFDSKGNSNLGAAILAKAVIVLDLVRDKFYLKPYENANLVYGSPIDFKYRDYKVTEVSPASKAYEAGVRIGQIVKAVDNHHFDSLTVCEQLDLDMRETFQQKNIQFLFESEDGDIVYNYTAPEPESE